MNAPQGRDAFGPARDASLVEVLTDGTRTRIAAANSWAGASSAGRWLAQPLGMRRGHAIVAAVLVAAASIELASLERRSSPPVTASPPSPRPIPAHAQPVEAPPSSSAPTTQNSALRLRSGQASTSSGRAVAKDARAVRSQVSPAISGLPELAGIAGRLPGNALLLIRDHGRTRPLGLGGEQNGWRLVELSAAEAVFERDGARRTVALPAAE